jgi:hypothetical protein
MRWLLLALCACVNGAKPTSLEGTITCGAMTCGTGQICYSMESGSQCDVNPDAGIGQYQEFGWTCGTLPDDCDGITRDCFSGPFESVSDDGRHVTHLCI